MNDEAQENSSTGVDDEEAANPPGGNEDNAQAGLVTSLLSVILFGKT